jgi:hypothetical protein
MANIIKVNRLLLLSLSEKTKKSQGLKRNNQNKKFKK